MVTIVQEPGLLYLHTRQDKRGQRSEDRGGSALADRQPAWDLSLAREAAVCHEWWTAHAHDSRWETLP